MRIYTLGILAVIGLAVPVTGFAQSSSGGSGSSGSSGSSTQISNDTSADFNTETVTMETRTGREGGYTFVGGPNPDGFVGRIEATGGTRTNTGNGGINRSATRSATTSSRSSSSVNSGNSNRTSGGIGGSNINSFPYLTDFDEHRVPGELYPLNGPTPQAISKIKGKIDRLPRVRQIVPVNVDFNGTEAVLSGVVGSHRDRAQLEQMVRLEPGVWSVRNDLKVVGEEH